MRGLGPGGRRKRFLGQASEAFQPNARVSWGLAILLPFRLMMARPPAGPACWVFVVPRGDEVLGDRAQSDS